jgi:hypothetical protein
MARGKQATTRQVHDDRLADAERVSIECDSHRRDRCSVFFPCELFHREFANGDPAVAKQDRAEGRALDFPS